MVGLLVILFIMRRESKMIDSLVSKSRLALDPCPGTIQAGVLVSCFCKLQCKDRYKNLRMDDNWHRSNVANTNVAWTNVSMTNVPNLRILYSRNNI